MQRWPTISTLVFTCIFLSFHGIARGQEPIAAISLTEKDTSGLNKQPVLKDPKMGFKNLFTTVDLGNGVKAEKLNPRAISFVQDYVAKNGKGLRKMKDWGKPYFDLMDAILSQHGVPQQLKYLAVIESGLRYNAKSWAGAVGPWAFMPAAAAEYGLRVTRYSDERLDYFKSTHAAASLLTDLYARYGDWLLVVAAYNGGPGNVDKAIRKSGSRDFWTLQYHLPNESMNHVKKFIATHYIMEGEGGITTATKEEVKNMLLTGNAHLTTEEINGSRQQIITGRYNAAVLARHIEMDIALFNRYNPGFDNEVALNGHYQLRLPHEKMDLFLARKPAILNESLQLLLKPLNTGSR
jgi:membrane-bound lytic murein transglycosylase D